MFSSQSLRSAWRGCKRLKVSNPSRTLATTGSSVPPVPPTENANTNAPAEAVKEKAENVEVKTEPKPAPTPITSNDVPKEWADRLDSVNTKFRLPRSVQAVYLKPLRRTATHGLPVCDLQLRSYSARHVEFFSDFALRAAYYLGLPASGPVPLPRVHQRWTTIKSNFVHKKSQENFERITMRRLIQIKDGHPDVVQAWLAFLRKHAFHGVGMKANVWEHTSLGVGNAMDEAAKEVEKMIEPELSLFGTSKKAAGAQKSLVDILDKERFTHTSAPINKTMLPSARQTSRLARRTLSPNDAHHLSRPLQRPLARAASSTTTTTSSSSSSSTPSSPRIVFSGIQPTGIPHLGNYLGALRQWVQLQNTYTKSPPSSTTTTSNPPSSSSRSPDDAKLIFSIVDLHALTVPQDPVLLRQWRMEMLAVLLAVGLDPRRCVLFFQSAVPAHAELMWILSTVSSMGYLSRMTQWKSKLQLPENSSLDDSSARARLRLGLFSYPVLQAADVLVHRATEVPVGEDQKQHLEFVREVANSFNHIYGPVLTMPEAMISPAKRVMSLKQPTLKMSKSHADPRSRILLSDPPEEIRAKIKQALTDSESGGITYDPVRRPGVANLIEILSHFEESSSSSGSAGRRTFEEVARENEGVGMRVFKERVAESVVGALEGVRERYVELMGEGKRAYLRDVADEGARKAEENARITLDRVKEAVGM
ncbi:tryptophan-tRNA ligase [Polytolypa hystricis UAMH7299]|uniref:Small ribosomal subunit protein uS10m n=1 Tax=Polytolypa hystricis (strain UAMH7299) TaxID=1447883 RepID=A0A2B7Z507_POLH7|nr:tryptophan-tRNA ligase [Polytolypa hystricis UAMH7299]